MHMIIVHFMGYMTELRDYYV